MAVPKKKTSKAKGRSRQAADWMLRRPARSVCPQCQDGQDARTWCAPTAAGTRVARPSRSTDLSRRGERPSPETLATLPVAVDAMGGDKAPGEIVEGPAGPPTSTASAVVLVGPPDQVGDTGGLALVRLHRGHRHGRGPRRRRAAQEGLLAGPGRRAGARRQGVGHGQRRQHRGHHGLRAAAHGPAARRRPARASPPRCPASGRTPAVLVDAGANAECTPAMLVQFAQMGAAYVAARFGTASPTRRPALDRGGADQGHAAGQGDPRACWSDGRRRGLRVRRATSRAGTCCPSPADVVVTDGFTGNVALKTLEGALRFLFDTVLERLR